MALDQESTVCLACFDHSPGDTHCEECGLEIDAYGNTEDEFRFCSFPDCGCDGARLCMAGEASEDACRMNVEGMWLGGTPERVRAVGELSAFVSKRSREEEAS